MGSIQGRHGFVGGAVSLAVVLSCGGEAERSDPGPPDAAGEDAGPVDAGGDGAAAECDGCLALVGARIFDGSAARPGTVVLEDGLVREVLWGADAGRTWATELDLTGHTILPGFVDLHVHLSDPAGPEGFFTADRFLDEHLGALLRAGVTTALDLGNDRHVVGEVRRRIRRGELLGPDLYAVGSMVTVSGGHPCREGFPVGRVCLLVDSPEDVVVLEDDLLPFEPDAIKVVTNRGFSIPTLSAGSLAAITELASASGLPVIAHVATPDDVEEGLDARVRIFGHVPMYGMMDRSLVARLAAEGAVVIPTLAVNETLYDLSTGSDRYEDPGLADDVPAEVLAALRADAQRARSGLEIDHVAQRRETAFENLRDCAEAGVRIATGTDSGIYGSLHGRALHDEVVLYVEQIGMTPAQALSAASRVPAEALGLTDRGAVAAGMRADLVVVEGDPLEDIADVRRVVKVFRAGVDVDRDGLSVLEAPELRIGTPPQGALDEACLFEDECADGLACDTWNAVCSATCTFPSSTGCRHGETSCSPAGLCAHGDACDPAAQDCPNDAACSWTGNGVTACWPASDSGAGESCAMGAFCEPGSQCDFATGRCYELCSEEDPCDGAECVDLSAVAGMAIGQCVE